MIENCFRITALVRSNQVSIEQVGTPDTVNLEYRTTNHLGEIIADWTPYEIGTQIGMANGHQVEFRNNTGTFSTSATKYYKISALRNIKVSGNINSLLDYTQDHIQALPNQCFTNLFDGCTTLTDASELELPSNPQQSSYGYMFRGCTSLTSAPKLPSKTIANRCYRYMFQNCTSLEKAPELPATTLASYCYQYMFSGCTSLNEIRIGYTGDFSTATTNTFSRWVENVSPTGTFYYNGSDTTRSVSAIPEGWEIVKEEQGRTFYLNGKLVKSISLEKPISRLFLNGRLIFGKPLPKIPYIETKGTVDSYWASTADLGIITGQLLPFCWEGTFQLIDTMGNNATAIFAKNFLLSSGLVQIGLSSNEMNILPRFGVSGSTSEKPYQIKVTGDDMYLKHHYKSFVENGVQKHSLDDGEIIESSLTPDLNLSGTAGNYPCCIGVRFNAKTLDETPESPIKCRVWNWKVWQDGNLMFDLIPWKDGDQIGMKDNVTGKFIVGKISYTGKNNEHRNRRFDTGP